MNILFLGPIKSPQESIIDFLSNTGDSVNQYDKKLNTKEVQKYKYDFLISFGYRYIIRKEVLNLFKEKAVNLHISYLPWNKGSDPNLWSILENTPKGVTIHRLDCGLDTGEILFQKEMFFDNDDTLKSSYEKLQIGLVELFKENWKNIKYRKVISVKQEITGSYHKSSDKNSYLKLLTDGWDTRIKNLKGKAINV